MLLDLATLVTSAPNLGIVLAVPLGLMGASTVIGFLVYWFLGNWVKVRGALMVGLTMAVVLLFKWLSSHCMPNVSGAQGLAPLVWVESFFDPLLIAEGGLAIMYFLAMGLIAFRKSCTAIFALGLPLAAVAIAWVYVVVTFVTPNSKC